MGEVPAVLRSRAPAQTDALGRALARQVRAGDVVGLVGDLGAGKTLLVQGLAAGLAVPPEVRVTSPTFTLVNEYRGGRLPLYHADLYRLEREHELDEIGLDDLIRRGDGVVVVEWCDRFRILPRDALTLVLTVEGEAARRIELVSGGARSRALAEALVAEAPASES